MKDSHCNLNKLGVYGVLETYDSCRRSEEDVMSRDAAGRLLLMGLGAERGYILNNLSVFFVDSCR